MNGHPFISQIYKHIFPPQHELYCFYLYFIHSILIIWLFVSQTQAKFHLRSVRYFGFGRYDTFEVMLWLTWHPVNSFERSQDSHCSNGREVDVLQVQRVFHHPAKYTQNTEKMMNGVTSTNINEKRCFHSKGVAKKMKTNYKTEEKHLV